MVDTSGSGCHSRIRLRRYLAFGAAAVIAALTILILIPRRAILEGVPKSRLITDRHGAPLRLFLTEDEKYRLFRHIADFPPQFLEIVLLQEDRHYYYHPGVNPISLVRAGWQTYVRRERRIGGSTVTMQLARLRYGFTTHSILGKIRQILVSIRLEILHGKQEILEAYLNLVPCGGNIEGFPAAAFYYFGKDIGELALSEQLLLAVIPQDPTARAPRPGFLPAELLEARSILADSWINRHPQDVEISETLMMPVSAKCQFPFEAPHFSEYLDHTLPPSNEMVASTLDLGIQKLAENLLERHIDQFRRYGVLNGAVMIADYRTMEVLASVGSADYMDDGIQGQVNGVTAKRSPGSTLKPFIYALAMDQGLITPDTILKDTPGSFSEYTPDNYRSDFKGAVPAWQALVDSRNIPAVSLAHRLSDPDLHDLLAAAALDDLKDKDHYGLSIVLGSAEVSMMELTSLYAALANAGRFNQWRVVRSDPKESAPGVHLVSPDAAWLTLEMLTLNTPPFEYRPGETEGIPVAFKTGTSIGFKDAWCVAVFGPYVAAVWIGNFDGLGNTAFLGRSMATPLLFRIIDGLLARETRHWRFWQGLPPGNLRKVPVCAVSGELLGELCPTSTPGWFIPGISPISRCDIHREVFIDTMTGYRTDRRASPGVIAQVREFWTSDMLTLFEEAGLPRLTPPPYPPDSFRYGIRGGRPPQIIYPLQGPVHILNPKHPRYSMLALTASADADVSELLWFSDSSFIGRSAPNEVLEWTAPPGRYDLTAVDDSGRSATILLDIEHRSLDSID